MLGKCGVGATCSAFEYPGTPDADELASSILLDVLPPTCLSADLKALDDAFNIDDCNAFYLLRRSLLITQTDGREMAAQLCAKEEGLQNVLPRYKKGVWNADSV